MPPKTELVKLDHEGTEAAIRILGKLDKVVRETNLAINNTALYEAVPGAEPVAKHLDKMLKEANEIKEMLKKKRAISKAQLDKFMQELEEISQQMKTTKIRTPGAVGAGGKKVIPTAIGVKPNEFDQQLQKIRQTAGSLTAVSQEISQLGKTLVEHADLKHRSWWQKIVNAVVGFVNACANKLKGWLGIAKGIQISSPTPNPQANQRQLANEAATKRQYLTPPPIRTTGPLAKENLKRGSAIYQHRKAGLRQVEKRPLDLPIHKATKPRSGRGSSKS